MSALFGLPHITQLHEIQKARLKKGEPGIGLEVQDLIRRLTDGGVAHIDGDLDAVRYAQAKRYWDIGVGRALGSQTFKDYLAWIPTPRQLPLTNRTLMHPQLLLVEPRVSFAKLRELLGITWCQTWVEERSGGVTVEKPFWVAYDDGARHRGMTIAKFLELQRKCVFDCTREDGGRMHGFTAFIAVCAFVQNRDIVREGDGTHHDPYYLHLVGTHDKKYGYANLLVAPGGGLQIRDGYRSRDACPAYGIPSYARL